MANGEPCSFAVEPVVTIACNAGPTSTASVFRCTRCGLGVTRPMIGDVSALYDQRDSQDYQRRDSAFARAVKRLFFGMQARGFLRRIDGRPAHIVDFACGSGVLTMAIAAQLPAGSTVTALDFFDRPPQPMEGIDYRSFAALEALAGSADVVTCFHALEHDDDPDAFLDRVLPLLKAGGTLVLEVPDIDCLWARPFGPHWDAWYLPYHRLHFSRASLTGLLERRGLTIRVVRKICVPTLGRSIARLAKRPNGLFFMLLGAALHPVQWLGEKLTGRPSALQVIATLG